MRVAQLGVLAGAILVHLDVLKDEYRVTSRTALVHASRLDVHPILSLLDVVEDLLWALHWNLV